RQAICPYRSQRRRVTRRTGERREEGEDDLAELVGRLRGRHRLQVEHPLLPDDLRHRPQRRDSVQAPARQSPRRRRGQDPRGTGGVEEDGVRDRAARAGLVGKPGLVSARNMTLPEIVTYYSVTTGLLECGPVLVTLVCPQPSPLILRDFLRRVSAS